MHSEVDAAQAVRGLGHGTISRRLILIAVAGLVVRLVYVFGPGRHVRGYGDYHYFHEAANLIASGHWFVDPVATLGHPVGSLPSATHPPLWTLLLGGVSWLGGTGELAHRAFGCLVGAVTIVLAGLLGRRVGGDRVGVAAALIAAVYPVLIGADGSLMSESLYGALIAGVLLLGFEMRSRPRVWTAVALGAAIGLAALTRAEGLVLLLLLAFPVTVVRAPRTGLLPFGACLAACLVVIAPWLVRNWIELGRPVLISTNDGSLLAGANCNLTYHGKDLGLWTTNCLSPRVFSNEADQDARWRSEAVSYAGDHAGRLPVVVGVRVLRSFDLYQPWRMTPFAEGRLLKADKLGVLSYFVLIPFAVFGLWLLRRRRWALLILLAPVAMVVLQSAFGYGFPRFRHPADVVMVVLGAVAVVRLLEWRAARAAQALILLVAIAAACAGCGGAPSHPRKPATGVTTAIGLPPRLNIDGVVILVPGTRADKLIACLRGGLNRAGLSVRYRHRVVVVADLHGRSDRVLRRLITDNLNSCDRRWRDVALFGRNRGPKQSLFGSSP